MTLWIAIYNNSKKTTTNNSKYIARQDYPTQTPSNTPK